MFRQYIPTKKSSQQTSWLPSKFAEVGRTLRLVEDDGWTVISVGASMTDEQIKLQSQRIHGGVMPSLKK